MSEEKYKLPRDFEKFWQNNEWFVRRLVQSNHPNLIQDQIYPEDDPAITSDDVLAGVKAFMLSPDVTTADPVWTLYRGKDRDRANISAVVPMLRPQLPRKLLAAPDQSVL